MPHFASDQAGTCQEDLMSAVGILGMHTGSMRRLESSANLTPTWFGWWLMQGVEGGVAIMACWAQHYCHICALHVTSRLGQ